MQNLLVKNISLFYVRSVLRVLFAVMFIFACAQIIVPLKPVVITLQTVAVNVIALAYRRNEAVYSVLLYIFLGAIGLPIFTKMSGGFGVLAGPHGGYLMGFVFATYVMSTLKMIYGEASQVRLVLYSIVGLIIIYSLGLIHLRMMYASNWFDTFKFGLFPFVLPGIAKTIFAVFLYKITAKGRTKLGL